MNIREAGAAGARRFTAAIAVVSVALASIVGVSVWAGTAAAAQNSSTTSVNTDQHEGFGDDGGSTGVGGSNGVSGSGGFGGFVAPAQGGGVHANSNGS